MSNGFIDGTCYFVIGPVTWKDLDTTEYQTFVVDPSMEYDPDVDPDDDDVFYVAESAGEIFDLVARTQRIEKLYDSWSLDDITCVKYRGGVYEGAAAWDLLENLYEKERNA